MTSGTTWNRSARRALESGLGQRLANRESVLATGSRRKRIIAASIVFLIIATLGLVWVVQQALAGSSLRPLLATAVHRGSNPSIQLHPASLQRISTSLPAYNPDTNHTLRFPVCNSFTDQRLSLVHGILLAQRLQRVPVLPGTLLRDGTRVSQSPDRQQQQQDSSSGRASNPDNFVPFGEVYDIMQFVTSMAKAGIRVLLPQEAPPPEAYTFVDTFGLQPHVVSALSDASYSHVSNLAVDCPLLRMAPHELQHARDGPVVWAVLEALRPAPEVEDLVSATLRAATHTGLRRGAASPSAGQERGRLGAGAGPGVGVGAGAGTPASVASAGTVGAAEAEGGSGAAGWQAGAGGAGGGRESGSSGGDGPSGGQGGLNFLQLPMENGWLEHCARWTAIPDGVVRDNCYNHTETVDERLASFGVTPQLPLYVAADWADVDPDREQQVLGRLRSAGYTVVTSREAFPPGLRGRDRELRAAVEYHLGLRAERHIGNSVSTFTALALMERRHQGRWSAYYNGGNVPLAPYLPVLKVPWVFTYNSWSGAYDYMLRAAVRSAAAIGTLTPYCIFDGNLTSPIATWLAGQGVTLMRHVPAWREQLLERAQSKMQDNVAHSHLFKDPDALVSTFQRVDLPLVPLLDQYTYVLYTDADVYFRRPIALEDFGLPLPRSISMSYEIDKMFPYNAGIILANLPVMRENYKPFIAMMLDNDQGLYYTNYGPADQGIMNKYYEADLRAQMLNQAFNAKPYNDFDPQSFIAHYHGPKPHDYLRYLEGGDCGYGRSLCDRAASSGLCPYAREWAVHAQPRGPPHDSEGDAPPDTVGARLVAACSARQGASFGATAGTAH